MAVYITGDVHGQEGLAQRLHSKALRLAAPSRDDYLIICGDFGCIWDRIRDDGTEPPSERRFLDRLGHKGPVILFVPGNHENYDRLTGVSDPAFLDNWYYKTLSPAAREKMLSGYPRKPWHGGFVREIRPWVLMLEDGIFDIEGRKILAVGGAPSHDVRDGILDPEDYDGPVPLRADVARMSSEGKFFRVKHLSWWPQEIPAKDHLDTLLDQVKNASVDVIVSHDMPQSVRSTAGFTDEGPVAVFMDALKSSVRYGRWYCGHYHADGDLPDNVTVLYHSVRMLRGRKKAKMTDKEPTLMEAIRQAERDGCLIITHSDGQAVATDDLDLDKYIEYRLAQPSQDWYRERIRYMSGEAERMAGYLKDQLADLLMSLDPDMTRTLQAIYLIAGADDLDAVCEASETEFCELPECIDPEDPDSPLGCLWGSQCSIILDLSAIDRAAEENADADHRKATEFDIGVFTTATHEIYHLAAADPFLELEDSEEAAEAYGIEAYEKWKYGR